MSRQSHFHPRTKPQRLWTQGHRLSPIPKWGCVILTVFAIYDWVSLHFLRTRISFWRGRCRWDCTLILKEEATKKTFTLDFFGEKVRAHIWTSPLVFFVFCFCFFYWKKCPLHSKILSAFKDKTPFCSTWSCIKGWNSKTCIIAKKPHRNCFAWLYSRPKHTHPGRASLTPLCHLPCVLHCGIASWWHPQQQNKMQVGGAARRWIASLTFVQMSTFPSY